LIVYVTFVVAFCYYVPGVDVVRYVTLFVVTLLLRLIYVRVYVIVARLVAQLHVITRCYVYCSVAVVVTFLDTADLPVTLPVCLPILDFVTFTFHRAYVAVVTVAFTVVWTLDCYTFRLPFAFTFRCYRLLCRVVFTLPRCVARLRCPRLRLRLFTLFVMFCFVRLLFTRC